MISSSEAAGILAAQIKKAVTFRDHANEIQVLMICNEFTEALYADFHRREMEIASGATSLIEGDGE
jgi:hypothetical protein